MPTKNTLVTSAFSSQSAFSRINSRRIKEFKHSMHCLTDGKSLSRMWILAVILLSGKEGSVLVESLLGDINKLDHGIQSYIRIKAREDALAKIASTFAPLLSKYSIFR